MTSEDESDTIVADINVTPLTDVFLVLVVIFMISALAAQCEREREAAAAAERRIELHLPPGVQHELDPREPALVIDVPLAGGAMVAGKPVADDELDRMFRAAAARDRDMRVILRADRGVPHGRVVDLMNRARRAGLAQLAIGTGAM
jgi:biopolymer transport protein ExbD